MILAAGESTRMGSSKVTLPCGSTTMVGSVVNAAIAAELAPVIVVSGFHGDAVSEAVGGSALVVHNPHPELGNLSSLVAGLDAVGDADAAVVLVADMPNVSSAVIVDLVDGLVASGCAGGWVEYSDGRGHPIALAASTFVNVRMLSGTKPLWPFLDALRRDQAFVLRVDAAKPIDVNTPEDYARLTERTENQTQLRD